MYLYLKLLVFNNFTCKNQTFLSRSNYTKNYHKEYFQIHNKKLLECKSTTQMNIWKYKTLPHYSIMFFTLQWCSDIQGCNITIKVFLWLVCLFLYIYRHNSQVNNIDTAT